MMPEYPYVYIIKRYNHPKTGKRCRIIKYFKGNRNVLLEFEDGFRMITTVNGIRKGKCIK